MFHDIFCKYNKNLKFRMATNDFKTHMNLIVSGTDKGNPVFHCVTATPEDIKQLLRTLLEPYPVHISLEIKQLLREVAKEQLDK